MYLWISLLLKLASVHKIILSLLYYSGWVGGLVGWSIHHGRVRSYWDTTIDCLHDGEDASTTTIYHQPGEMDILVSKARIEISWYIEYVCLGLFGMIRFLFRKVWIWIIGCPEGQFVSVIWDNRVNSWSSLFCPTGHGIISIIAMHMYPQSCYDIEVGAACT